MGYIRGLIHGSVIGTLAGLAIAPQTGDKTRSQVQGIVLGAQKTVKSVQRTARRVAPQVQDAARSAVDAANKVAGVRAALCTDAETATGARRWNVANVMAVSLRLTTEQLGRELVDAFLADIEADPGQVAIIASLER